MAAVRLMLVAMMAAATMGDKRKSQGRLVYYDKNQKGKPVEGRVAAQRFGPVVPALSQGVYEEDHEAWGDLPDSRFVNVPSWLVGVSALVPGHRLAARTLVEFHCPKTTTIKTHTLEACDAFVFLYRCPPCPSGRANLEQLLVADGWEASGCAMDFKTGTNMGNGYSHRMMALRKQFAPGTSVSFTTPDRIIDYAAFGLSSDAADCGTRMNRAHCEAAAEEKYGACSWNSETQTCVHTNFCRRLRGPIVNGVPKCLVCPDDELAAEFNNE